MAGLLHGRVTSGASVRLAHPSPAGHRRRHDAGLADHHDADEDADERSRTDAHH